MKKLKLSGFDLGMVIAFVVTTLLGVGAWWYFSSALQFAVDDPVNGVTAAKASFDKYSSNPQFHVVVSASNLKTLQENIDLIKTQLLPVIQTEFRSKDNKLTLIDKVDPVTWKHSLDDEVRRLNAAAKSRNVGVPPNFYFGFSRYLSENPGDDQTVVLTKQLLGIEQIANILIGAQVRDILAIRRTYEEDPRGGSTIMTEGDHLSGTSTRAGAYTTYPFEVDFDTTTENLRPVINSLIQSPYVFVVRSISVKNSNGASPAISVLDQMAGTPPSSVVDTSPGEVAATTSTKGPQYLFGNETLAVSLRVDMIEWTADVSAISDHGGVGQNGGSKKPQSGGGL